MLRWIALTLLILICSATACGAQQPIPFPGEPPYTLPKRVALVIGVENYSGGGAVQLPPLPGAGNDARNMSKVLGDAGFEVTTLLAKPPSTWVTQDQINDAITDLILAAKDARTQTGRGAIVAFYFAGHGLRTADKNYLLPSRFSATFVENIPNRAIELEGQIINAFSAPDIAPELKIIIIYACRTSAPASLPSSQGTDAIELRRGTASSIPRWHGLRSGQEPHPLALRRPSGKSCLWWRYRRAVHDQICRRFERTVNAGTADCRDTPQVATRVFYKQVWTFMMTLNVKKQLPNMDENVLIYFLSPADRTRLQIGKSKFYWCKGCADR